MRLKELNRIVIILYVTILACALLILLVQSTNILF
jgi:cell division protein FtsL